LKGVKVGHATHPIACPDLMKIAAASQGGGQSAPRGGVVTSGQERFNRGQFDEFRLGLDTPRRLPGCFVPVPDAP